MVKMSAACSIWRARRRSTFANGGLLAKSAAAEARGSGVQNVEVAVRNVAAAWRASACLDDGGCARVSGGGIKNHHKQAPLRRNVDESAGGAA